MSEYVLKYRTPAGNSGETIPVGNGCLGGMIYGNPSDELIKINLDSFWSGKHLDRINPDSYEGMREVRNLIGKGDISSAERTAFETMQGTPFNMRRFMPLLDLHISCFIGGKAKNYARFLNTENSVSSVEFDVGNKHFQRNYICTGDEGLVIGFFCDEDESISFDAWLEGREEFCTANRVDDDNDDRIVYSGGIGGSEGINFASCLAVKADGGEVRVFGNRICVRNADFVMLIFNARTDIDTEEPDEHKEMVMEAIDDAMNLEYEDILNNYISWYSGVFNRVELSLDDNSGENIDILATDERIMRLKGDELDSRECTRLINDNKLIELYFNFGRYLLISCGTSRQAVNVRGLWNDNPASSSRYILSGNTQMCYWGADVCGIKECFHQLFELAELICRTGRKTAEKMYGVKSGSVCHTETDLWGDSVPQGTSPDSIWCMGLAWLAIHVFEHYEYTMDRDFLEKRYNIMKRAAEFFVNYLVEDEKGRLVVSPSVSPTSAYIAENGSKAHFCSGVAVDSQILTVLFNDIIKASDILGWDDEFAETLKPLVARLPEIEVGRYGQIKEWNNDYDEAESPERLLYHLFALHPADLITPVKTPKLAAASRTTLIRRLIHGGLEKGWGCAWIANMWARLYDGNMVYECLKNLLTRSTYPNLINMYPDFQIDANMGAVSAITEALLQSTGGEIVLLPALPQEWSKGSVRGLRAKGGFEVSMEWSGGKLTGAEIKSNAGKECRIRVMNSVAVSIICEDEDINPRIENGIIIFNTTAEMTYIIRC
ncbi:MAG: glycoside hydrolase family 95 protein [Ruminococcus flavefaciens]|nr:glycoside hydrolase family 95 protein [Ruminococcus flavefaciens]MCM1228735.1 glycoside hydrolase family 95 protein [Ruminococcus flavefaciens]